MNMLKLIGGVVLGLLVIFFAAGLIMPQVNYQIDVTLHHPLEKTWQAFTDRSTRLRWVPDLKKMDTIEEVPGGLGSTYRLIFVREGKEQEMKETITEYVPQEWIVRTLESADLHKTEKLTFLVSSPGHTLLEDRVTLRASTYLNRCVLAFQRNQYKRSDQEYLESFQQFVE